MTTELKNLIEQYVILHSDPKVYMGNFTIYHASRIKLFLEKFNCKTILDYGSGKGEQYYKDNLHVNYFNNILPSLYDPGVKDLNVLPNGTFDLVICTDVLEHIPENLLPSVVNEIYSKANKCVYLGINNTKHGISNLPDGRCVHLTTKRGEWWINKLKPLATKITRLHVYGELGSCDALFDYKGLKEYPSYV